MVATFAKLLLLLGVLMAITGFAYRHLPAHSIDSYSDQTRELMYMPKIEAAKLLSFGYKNVFADVIWFNTISYFSKHYNSDRNFEFLKHLCELITELDPKALHVYEFGATMLAWEKKDAESAITLLTTGIKANPTYWKLPYLRGFMNLFFLHNNHQAAEDLATASKLPGAHVMVARLAAKTMSEADDPNIAVAFLIDMMRTTEDPTVKSALNQRLLELRQRTREFYKQQIIDLFNRSHISLPQALSYRAEE